MPENLSVVMKKAILVVSACICLNIMSSCTKVYDCTCTTETTDTLTKVKSTSVTMSKKREKSKGLATAKCEQGSYTFASGYEKRVTTCAISDKKK